MESLCEYLMYFPAGPLADYRRYRGLPRRSHLYLGETVRFVLVVRCRGREEGESEPEAQLPPGPAWRRLSASLSALASVCPGLRRPDPPLEDEPPPEGPGPGGELGLGLGAADPPPPPHHRPAHSDSAGFRHCRPLLTHNGGPSQGGGETGGEGGGGRRTPAEEPIISNDEVIFPLTVALDKLPVGTIKAKIIVTVWKRDQEKAEVREHGYLTILQNRNPSHIFREDQSTFKAQVSTLLTVLPPPTVKCRQLNVSGKQLTVIKVLNTSSQEEISVQDVQILPNFNASYLPMMPDGSVLLVDNVCHQSGDVSIASFYRMDGKSSHLPVKLSALEEQAFLFQLQVNERPQQDTKEGLEVPLTAIVRWSTTNLPPGNKIYTHYR
uniref:trafficking protein particle complex subunit 14-like n=1 Tax=Pristiophorus japonicus TaxID=55135 RepID=UPI00398E86B8